MRLYHAFLILVPTKSRSLKSLFIPPPTKKMCLPLIIFLYYTNSTVHYWKYTLIQFNRSQSTPTTTPTMMSSTTSLPVPAKMRLTRELSLFSKSPPPGISCYTPNDTLTHLHAQIAGKSLIRMDSFLFSSFSKMEMTFREDKALW